MAKANEQDPHEIDVDAEIDPEGVMDTARKTFKLGDRLKGIKHAHTKITLFTDPGAISKYHELNKASQDLVDSVGKVNLKLEGGPAMHDRLVASFNELEPKLDEAKTEMLKSALSVHLHAWPSKVSKQARNKARRKFHSDLVGGVPPEKQAEASEYVDMLLLGQTILKIVDASGAEADLQPYKVKAKGKGDKVVDPRDTLGTEMSDELPPSQWMRLYNAYQTLTLTDQIGESATEDAGF